MNRIIRLLRAALPVAVLAAAFTAAAQEELKIFTAIEVEFATAPGKTYQLQGSSDLAKWSDIGDPAFGNGLTINRLFSSRSVANVTFGSYRLNIITNPTVGLAPWSFAGLSISFGDDATAEHRDFLTETNGVRVSVEGNEPFSYSMNRTGENEVQVNIIRSTTAYYADRHDLHTFTFTTPKLGTFVLEQFRNGRLKDRDVGAFHVLDGGQPPGDPNQPPGTPTAPPQSLAGLAYSFQSGELPERLDFLTDTTGLMPEDKPRPGDDHPAKLFTYAYSLTTPTNATLVVTLPDNRRDEYALTFTQGAQGTYVRREYRNDVLDDTDSGAFSPAGAAVGSDGGNNSGPGSGPDASLAGATFTMKTGETPDTLAFITSASGVEQSSRPGDDPSNFTYAYSVKDGVAASLVVHFKADKWDEYDLTFSGAGQGQFVRREFRNGVLDRTVNGTFARVTGN